MARPTGRPLGDELVDEARLLIQQLGVNGFSYGMLAERLGVRSPSIHHHFRTKEDLVAEVATRYRADFAASVAAIGSSGARDRLSAYAELYAETSSRGELCLCGAVAAEWASVGDKPRRVVEGFFADQHTWLAKEIEIGLASGELRADLDAPALASAILATLEGALLLARADGSSVSTSADAVIGLLVSA